MKNIVLVSGGLDSAITMHYVERAYLPGGTVIPLHFILDTRYRSMEEAITKKLFSAAQVDLSFNGLTTISYESSYIPNRNAHLVLGAAGRFYSGEEGVVWLTVQKDETDLVDRSPEFFANMNLLLSAMKYKVQVKSPWMNHDKTSMVKWALDNGMTAQDLRDTFSCYYPIEEYKGCGNCAACFRRWVSLSLNGIDESSEHREHPGKSFIAGVYRKKAFTGEYSTDRNLRILEAFSCLK